MVVKEKIFDKMRIPFEETACPCRQRLDLSWSTAIKSSEIVEDQSGRRAHLLVERQLVFEYERTPGLGLWPHRFFSLISLDRAIILVAGPLDRTWKPERLRRQREKT